MNDLRRILEINSQSGPRPVAFATNAMYVLARNGLSSGDHQAIESVLLPLVKEKAEYLHAEGVAQLAYALSQAEIWDEASWSIIREKIPQHEFNCLIVKNERWSLKHFIVHSGNEHFF